LGRWPFARNKKHFTTTIAMHHVTLLTPVVLLLAIVTSYVFAGDTRYEHQTLEHARIVLYGLEDSGHFFNVSFRDSHIVCEHCTTLVVDSCHFEHTGHASSVLVNQAKTLVLGGNTFDYVGNGSQGYHAAVVVFSPTQTELFAYTIRNNSFHQFGDGVDAIRGYTMNDYGWMLPIWRF
jgi:hypothetical protein